MNRTPRQGKTPDALATLLVGIGLIVVGLALLTDAHTAARQIGVGADLGLGLVLVVMSGVRWRRARS